MADKDLEKRIAQIEDIEAIRKLKGRYCLHVDERNEDAWASLFTEDGVWESDKFGVHEGREAIRALFRSIPEFLSFAVHYVTNPIIEVDGEWKFKRLKLISSFWTPYEQGWVKRRFIQN
jgi:hypothetical protein